MTESRNSLPARLRRAARAMFGFPDARKHWPVLIAVGIDTLGLGLIIPITLLYFVLVTRLRIVEIGALLSLATIIAVPASLLGGELVHRFGARTVMIANNLCSCAGYVLYLLSGRVTTIFAGMLLVAVGERLWGASWVPYLGTLSNGETEFSRWFSFIEVIKSAAILVGALVATVIFAVAGSAGPKVVMAVNAATCLVAAGLISVHRVAKTTVTESADRSWLPLLRQRRYLTIAVGNLLIAPVGLLIPLTFPVFFVRDWHLPTWIGPTIFALSYAVTLVFQSPVTRALQRVRIVRRLALGETVAVAALLLLLVTSASASHRHGVALTVAVVATFTLTLAGCVLVPAISAVLFEATEGTSAGRLAGLSDAGNSIGAAAAPAVLGALLAAPVIIWVIMSVLGILACLCFSFATAGSRRDSARVSPLSVPE